MPSSFWFASTKPEAALARGQGWQPWQERGWTLAPRDRGPEAGMYCWKGHYLLLPAKRLAYASKAFIWRGLQPRPTAGILMPPFRSSVLIASGWSKIGFPRRSGP